MSGTSFEVFDTPAPRLKLRVSVETQQSILAGVAARWKDQYCDDNGKWSSTMDGSARKVYDKLIALPVGVVTVTSIAEIIGNESWTAAHCSTCREPELPVVLYERFDEYSSESDDTRICSRCLRAGVTLLDASDKGVDQPRRQRTPSGESE